MKGSQECFSSSSSSSSLSNQHMFSINAECWLIAERITEEILSVLQPTAVSEQKRMEVIDYVQRLIRGHFETEVKIVKCTVQHIAVDISFNQIAGLCSLCFLEQVDQLIGRDHLFKRSIILIKAWCYYESRILGAPYGLISTYALETLVLYIFNLFHSSLKGPLAVLYRFLDYYSTFNWDKYCISLNGPVVITSLPEVVVETPENNGSELLLSKEFLESYVEFFSVPMKASEDKGQTFSIKHFNIMDPLKDNNNLGRSVGKGNFHRIRFAFSYGAQKLREILMLPGENMHEELMKFFITTLNRNGRGQRPDVEVPVPVYGSGISEVSDLSGDYDSRFNGLQYGQWYHSYYTLPISIQSSPPTSPSLIQNKSACTQFYCAKDFVTRPLCNPNASQFFGSVLGIEEKANYQGECTYIPAVSVEEKLKSRKTGIHILDIDVEEKMKSRGTGTFIPNMGVEEELTPRGTGTGIHDMAVEENMKLQGKGTSRFDTGVCGKLKLRGTGACIPDMGVKENFTSGRTDTCIPEMGMEEKAKSQGPLTHISDMSVEEKVSRGTGVYYPDVAQHSYRKIYVCGTGRNPEPMIQGSLLKSSLNVEQVGVSLEADKDGSSSLFNLSLEEFPLLPICKKAIPSKSHQSVHTTAESPQAQKCSPRSESIEFGTFGHSPAPLATKQPDSGGATTSDSMLGNLTIATQGPPNSSESNLEAALVQQYQLEDDMDFPPLGM